MTPRRERAIAVLLSVVTITLMMVGVAALGGPAAADDTLEADLGAAGIGDEETADESNTAVGTGSGESYLDGTEAAEDGDGTQSTDNVLVADYDHYVVTDNDTLSQNTTTTTESDRLNVNSLSTGSSAEVAWSFPSGDPPGTVTEGEEFEVSVTGYTGDGEICLAEDTFGTDDRLNCVTHWEESGFEDYTFTVDAEDDLGNEDSDIYVGVDDGFTGFADTTTVETVEVTAAEIEGEVAEFATPSGTLNQGDEAEIAITIRNTGETRETFYYGTSLGPQTSGETYIQDSDTVTLDPWETETVSYSETVGDHWVEDDYRAGVNLWKSSSRDDQLDTVSEYDFSVDIIETEVSWDQRPPSDIRPDETYRVDAVGSSLDSADVCLYEEDGWSDNQIGCNSNPGGDFAFIERFDEADLEAAPGESTELYWEVSNGDSDTTSQETVSIAEFDVEGEVTEFATPSGTLNQGDEVEIAITIRNTGAARESFYYGASLGPQTSGETYIQDSDTVTLDPGESETVSYSETVGDHWIEDDYRAGVNLWKSSSRDDQLDTVSEYDFSVDIIETEVSWDQRPPSDIRPDETYRVDAVGSSLDSADVCLYEEDGWSDNQIGCNSNPGGDFAFIERFDEADLEAAPGESTELYWEVSNGDSATTSEETVQIETFDVEGEVTEFATPSGTLNQGDEAEITITIRNTGAARESFYYGASLGPQSSGETYIEDSDTVSLDPGESATVSYSETVGDHWIEDDYRAGVNLWESSSRDDQLDNQRARDFDVAVLDDDVNIEIANDLTNIVDRELEFILADIESEVSEVEVKYDKEEAGFSEEYAHSVEPSIEGQSSTEVEATAFLGHPDSYRLGEIEYKIVVETEAGSTISEESSIFVGPKYQQWDEFVVMTAPEDADSFPEEEFMTFAGEGAGQVASTSTQSALTTISQKTSFGVGGSFAAAAGKFAGLGVGLLFSPELANPPSQIDSQLFHNEEHIGPGEGLSIDEGDEIGVAFSVVDGTEFYEKVEISIQEVDDPSTKRVIREYDSVSSDADRPPGVLIAEEALNSESFGSLPAGETQEYELIIDLDGWSQDSFYIEVTGQEGDDPDPESPYFDIDGLSGDSSVAEGEALDVTVDIENTGEEFDEQVVTLEIDGTEMDAETVALEADNDETITLQWETEENDAGEYEATVATEDDTDTVPITVAAPDPPETTAIVTGDVMTPDVELIAGAAVDAINTQTGDVAATAETGPGGAYAVEVPIGHEYEMVARASGSATGQALVTVEDENRTYQADIIVSFIDEPPVADYANADGVVNTVGIRDAIDDWRGGEIDITLLRDVIDAWRTGAVVG